MQAKRFEPAWIAGTSVGAVSSQSDYHLKELPMANMRSPSWHEELPRVLRRGPVRDKLECP